MSVYDFLKNCRDGTIRYFERDNKGQFKKSFNPKFYNGQKVGFWNKEPQQKIVPEIDHSVYVKGGLYRASISLNVPLNGTKRKPNYKNFTYVVIDEKDKIDMQDMYEKLIEEMESKSGLGYKRDDFDGWFPYAYDDCDKQYPKPYSAKNPSATFEGT